MKLSVENIISLLEIFQIIKKGKTMNNKKTFFAFFLLLLLTRITLAQNTDLNIFGYYQMNYTNFDV